MFNCCNKLKGGFVITGEVLLISSVVVIGLIVGMVTLRNSVTVEVEDTAEAFGDLNQSYRTTSVLADNRSAASAGSYFLDNADHNADDDEDGNVGGADQENFSFIPCEAGEGWGIGTPVIAWGPVPASTTSGGLVPSILGGGSSIFTAGSGSTLLGGLGGGGVVSVPGGYAGTGAGVRTIPSDAPSFSGSGIFNLDPAAVPPASLGILDLGGGPAGPGPGVFSIAPTGSNSGSGIVTIP